MFILPTCNSKPVFPTSSEAVAIFKRDDIRYHYETKHGMSFEKNPLKSKQSAQKIFIWQVSTGELSMWAQSLNCMGEVCFHYLPHPSRLCVGSNINLSHRSFLN